MKITFLGTGAIGYPLSFCRCDNCEEARKRKGKSIRKRASILINDEMLIDLGPDVPVAMNMYNKNMSNIKYLLQTHTHLDHLDMNLFSVRIPRKVTKKLNTLEVFSHPKCLKYMNKKLLILEQESLYNKESLKKLNACIHPLKGGESIKINDYLITAIDCIHDKKNGSLLYVITYNNKNIFYATDTPSLTNKALKELQAFKLDLIIMDHTHGDNTVTSSHLNNQLFEEQLTKMRNLGIIDNNTLIYGTHISHESMSYHEKVEEYAIKHGYHIAYDGLELNI